MNEQTLQSIDLRPTWSSTYLRRYKRYSVVFFLVLLGIVTAVMLYVSLVQEQCSLNSALLGVAGFAVVTLILAYNMFRGFASCWIGQVTAKERREIWGRRTTTDGRRERCLLRTAHRVTIRTDGRRRRIEVQPAAYALIAEGDHMVKFRGMPAAVRVGHDGDAARICPSCGMPSERTLVRCSNCRFDFPPDLP